MLFNICCLGVLLAELLSWARARLAFLNFRDYWGLETYYVNTVTSHHISAAKSQRTQVQALCVVLHCAICRCSATSLCKCFIQASRAALQNRHEQLDVSLHAATCIAPCSHEVPAACGASTSTREIRHSILMWCRCAGCYKLH